MPRRGPAGQNGRSDELDRCCEDTDLPSPILPITEGVETDVANYTDCIPTERDEVDCIDRVPWSAVWQCEALQEQQEI